MKEDKHCYKKLVPYQVSQDDQITSQSRRFCEEFPHQWSLNVPHGKTSSFHDASQLSGCVLSAPEK